MKLTQIQQWYGAPGSYSASQTGTDMMLFGASEENLRLAASLITGGRTVSLATGSIVHNFFLYPGNKVSHKEFYRALNISIPNASDAEIWNDRGDKLFILGWKQESLECFFRAMSSNSSYADPWVNLSRYFMDPEVQDFQLAAICAQKAIDLDPNSDMAYANLGGIKFALGDLDDAIRYCSRAIEINNANFFGHYYIACALIRAGDYSLGKKRKIQSHALRCRDFLEQFPQARPIVEQIIAWSSEA